MGNDTLTYDPAICSPKFLPLDMTARAAEIARRINPANAPVAHPEAVFPEPEHLALLSSAYWGTGGLHATVGLMERAPAAFVDRLLSHMNAWNRTANVLFTYTDTDRMPMVRITRTGDGYWSYLGTNILSIPKGEPTMCLQAFDMDTPESEYRRVVRHETGHTLAFPHEHMRQEIVSLLDEAKTIAYFGRSQGWDAATVRAQVLTPLNPSSIRGTTPDQLSIMSYQIPAACTMSGRPIVGGVDIDESDYEFAASLYPRPDAVRPLTPDDIVRKLEGIF